MKNITSNCNVESNNCGKGDKGGGGGGGGGGGDNIMRLNNHQDNFRNI
jgi:hypothetical protein